MKINRSYQSPSRAARLLVFVVVVLVTSILMYPSSVEAFKVRRNMLIAGKFNHAGIGIGLEEVSPPLSFYLAAGRWFQDNEGNSVADFDLNGWELGAKYHFSSEWENAPYIGLSYGPVLVYALSRSLTDVDIDLLNGLGITGGYRIILGEFGKSGVLNIGGGMFYRIDEYPDGWSESGFDEVETGTLVEIYYAYVF